MAIVKRLLPLVVLLAIGGGIYWYSTRPVTSLTLTGTVTTHEIVVSPQIGGRIEKLLVNEGDQVAKDQLVAVLAPAELQQERAYYDASVEGAGSQIAESEAALRLQERQTADQIKQAQATLAATEAQHQAAQAQLEDARIAYDRQQRMMKDGVGTQEQLDRARTAADVARSQLAAVAKQVDAQRAAVALAESSAEQVAVRRSQVLSNRQQRAAVAAQRAKADVRLAYTEIHAPIAGIVDVRVALPGEVVNPGQPVMTLINPDDLWVRADVEETYVDRIKVGDKMKIRLPSGEQVEGEVFYRRVDAGFATQRDVSRTKRDIKTFEIRLKVDNKDRRLAVGMTTYVELPLTQPARPEGGQSSTDLTRRSLLAHVAEPRQP
jgi:HlyD family secretion protein